MIQKVCFVSREIEGIAGAGGLKDVVRGLADALAERGVDVTVVLPGYGFLEKGRFLHDIEVPLNGGLHRIQVSLRKLGRIKILLLGSPFFESKSDVYTYNQDDAPEASLIGKGHRDVNEMNILLQAGAVLSLMKSGDSPDIVHGHDGHCGFLPLYLKYLGSSDGFFGKTGVLITIHNAGVAYQQIPGTLEETVRLTGFPEDVLAPCVLNGMVNPLLAAGLYGHVNTVSPGYSRELLTGSDPYSGGLGPELSNRNIPVDGVYNGINPQFWTGGSQDFHPEKGFSKGRLRENLSSKFHNNSFEGISVYGAAPDPGVPWVLFHGRLTHQKGVDAILALPDILEGSGGSYRLIIYGQGDTDLEEAIVKRVASSESWLFLNGYNNDFTGELIAASSFVIVPSIWEPCGQIDMVGQLLGALPIVRAVGGLTKIRQFCDGFKYSPDDSNGLQEYLRLAINWERNKQRRVSLMRRRAENVVYGRRVWRKVLVRGYFPLYRKARKSIRH